MHRSLNKSSTRPSNLFLVFFTTLGLTLGNFTVFDFDPPAEAAHLRGAIVTAEYHAHGTSPEIHLQATQLVRKDSSGYFGAPTISKPSSSTCSVTLDGQTVDQTNPLFGIFISSWTIKGCIDTVGEYTFQGVVSAKIDGISNQSYNTSNQYEVKLVINDLGADTAAPTYSSGYMYNILYTGQANNEVNYSTNLNALAEGNQPVASYELVTDTVSRLGGYGASEIPCSNLDSATGLFTINKTNCKAGENLVTAFSGGLKLYVLKVRAIDAKGQYATRDVLLAFNTSSNKAPVFSSTSPSPGSLQAIPGGDPVVISITATDDDSANVLDFNLNTTRSWITKSAVSQTVVDGKKQATVSYSLAPPSGTSEILQLQISVFDNDTFSLSSTIQYDIEAGGVLPPGTPAKPTLLLVDGTSVQVSYAAPPSGGSVSSYFVVRTPVAGGAAVETLCPNGPSVPCLISGLDPSTAYNFQIRATNSSASATSSAASINTFVDMTTGIGDSFAAGDFVLGGDTTLTGNIAALTTNSTNRKGAIWSQSRINVNSDFIVEAKLFLGVGNGTATGADGIAFVMQPNSATSLSSGGGLGYAGMTPPVFAVEFDTYSNGGQETDSDHIALMKDGNATSHSSWGVDLVNVAELEDNQWRNYRFTWKAPTTSPAVNGKIRVEFDLNFDGDFTDSGEIIFEREIALDDYFSASSGNVYWGFTAATGGAANLQQVEITRYSGVSRTNASPTLTRATSAPVGLAAGTTKTVQLAMTDDSTTKSQWAISATSSDTNKVTVSSALATSATAATLTLSSPGGASSGTATITVVATDADGATSTITFQVGVGAAPGAPTALVAVAGNASVTLTWEAPADIGGFAILDYVIEISIGTSGTWAAVDTTTSTATSVSVPQLQNGTVYKFRVSAVSAAGTGLPSTESNSVTPAAPAGGGGSAPTPSPKPAPTPGSTDNGKTPRKNPPSTIASPNLAPSPAAVPSPTPGENPRFTATVIPERTPTPGVVYTPANPIPRELRDLLLSPLSYVEQGSEQSPETPSLSPAESLAYENGAPVLIELEVSSDQNGYILRGTNWEVSFEATDSDGTSLTLDDSGNLVLNSDRFVQFQGTGFAPGSIIKVWLFSDPSSLADVVADSNGNFTGSAQLPANIPTGEHTVQLNGLSKDGQIRSVALGVVVQPDVVAAPTLAPVDFTPLWNLLFITAGVVMMFLLVLVARRNLFLTQAKRGMRKEEKAGRRSSKALAKKQKPANGQLLIDEIDPFLAKQVAEAHPSQQFPNDSRRKIGAAAPPNRKRFGFKPKGA